MTLRNKEICEMGKNTEAAFSSTYAVLEENVHECRHVPKVAELLKLFRNAFFVIYLPP